MTVSVSDWRGLFTSPSPSNRRIRLRVLRKQCRDFLVLPADNHAAARALELYPAQTPLARAARLLLNGSLKIGFAPGASRVEISVGEAAPLLLLIRDLVKDAALPPFAVLVGNPAVPGRRYLIALFDETGQPQFVIKAGIEPDAQNLVARESAFLKQIQGKVHAAPRWRGEWESDGLRAFATDFVSGQSPRNASPDDLSAVLTPWLDEQTTIRGENLAVWQWLCDVSAAATGFEEVLARCGAREVRPALYHGDFAPWNVKLDRDGKWHVMDWERGEMQGPPAWDWFHFVTQPLLLVAQSSVETCAAELERHLTSPAFQKYATAAGIRDFAREWYLAYLTFSRDALRQTENVPRLNALLNLLRERWLSWPKSPARTQPVPRTQRGGSRHWVGRWLRPPGLHVAVLGPDGAGKSTLLTRLAEILGPSFCSQRNVHFRPQLFQKAEGGPVTNPHDQPPRGQITSVIKLIYYFFDHWLGRILLVWPAKTRNALVIYDRTFEDLLVDPKRYRLRAPGWLVRALSALLPKADVTFVLDAPAEIIHRRKPELSVEELRRQRTVLRDLAARAPRHHLIDATASPETVARDVADRVIEFMSRREMRRR